MQNSPVVEDRNVPFLQQIFEPILGIFEDGREIFKSFKYPIGSSDGQWRLEWWGVINGGDLVVFDAYENCVLLFLALAFETGT